MALRRDFFIVCKGLDKGIRFCRYYVFGDIERKKNELLEGVQEFDAKAETEGLVGEEKIKMVNMSKELENTLL